jgi:hypothetical protein
LPYTSQAHLCSMTGLPAKFTPRPDARPLASSLVSPRRSRKTDQPDLQILAEARAPEGDLSGERGSGAPACDGFRCRVQVTAHFTAFGLLRSALNPGQRRFAAHVAFYPAGNFGVIAEPSRWPGASSTFP